MNLEFQGGRSEKAVNLQSVVKTPTAPIEDEQMIALCDRYAERKGGDTWDARGAGGRWVRIHRTPRRSLFTPCRVPRGPAHPDKLQSIRRTVGIDANGDQFIVNDDWTCERSAHQVRELPWTGVTTFVTKSDEASASSIRKKKAKAKVRWCDEEDECEEAEKGEAPLETREVAERAS